MSFGRLTRVFRSWVAEAGDWRRAHQPRSILVRRDAARVRAISGSDINGLRAFSESEGSAGAIDRLHGGARLSERATWRRAGRPRGSLAADPAHRGAQGEGSRRGTLEPVPA